MKWHKRSLWLAAWGVWLWLGFGLYRELPRDLGPPRCELQLGKSESVAGFVVGRPEIITWRWDLGVGGYVYSASDARTGVKTREIGPKLTDEVTGGRTGRSELLARNLWVQPDWWNAYVPERWKTVAIRDGDWSLVVIVREWKNESRKIPYADGRQQFVMDYDRIIYRQRVNWPLLAVCHTILATPLVVIWVLLRRHRRAAKRKLAEEADMVSS